MTSPADPITRILALIFTIGLVAVALVFGFFFFLVILGASMLLAAAFWVRQKFMTGKGRREPGAQQVIDAEFQVLDKAPNDKDKTE